MNICPCCKVDFITNTGIGLCNWCSNNIPYGIIRLIDGCDKEIIFTDAEIMQNPNYIFPGTWTSENWFEYPNLKKRIKDK